MGGGSPPFVATDDTPVSAFGDLHVVDTGPMANTPPIPPRQPAQCRRVALVAHDNKKLDLLDWIGYNQGTLSQHDLLATGTTATLITDHFDLAVTRLLSGPLGGDQQLGARIAEGGVDVLIFFWDPLEPQPHDPDVKALLRIAAVWNVAVACNRSTADYIISSPLFGDRYEARLPAFDSHQRRQLPATLSAPLAP